MNEGCEHGGNPLECPNHGPAPDFSVQIAALKDARAIAEGSLSGERLSQIQSNALTHTEDVLIGVGTRFLHDAATLAMENGKLKDENAHLRAVIEEALTYLRGQGGEHFVAFDAAAAFNGVLAILAKATPKNESRGLNVDGGYTCPKCGEGPNIGLGEGGDLYHRCFAVPVGIEGEKTDQTLQEVLGVTLEEASRNAREMELELRARYFLKTEWADYVEVTKEQFVNAERSADFYNTMGQPNEPATGGFSGHGVSGKVEYSAPTTRDDADE
jgi:hypothetical protein